jgi:DNA repair exonuclease SbcCD ATPase subunit
LVNIQQFREKLFKFQGQKEKLISDIANSDQKINDLTKEVQITKKAQDIITAVSKITQDELQYRITEPVSLALASVYDNAYKMIADFKIAGRGTTECYLKFERDENQIKPIDASGGGPIDVASFALRIGAWSLKRPKNRPVLILDEPGRFVSRDKMQAFGDMIKETSKRLNIQILMISHINELIETGDKILEVKLKNGVSQVSEISETNDIIGG